MASIDGVNPPPDLTALAQLVNSYAEKQTAKAKTGGLAREEADILRRLDEKITTSQAMKALVEALPGDAAKTALEKISAKRPKTLQLFLKDVFEGTVTPNLIIPQSALRVPKNANERITSLSQAGNIDKINAQLPLEENNGVTSHGVNRQSVNANSAAPGGNMPSDEVVLTEIIDGLLKKVDSDAPPLMAELRKKEETFERHKAELMQLQGELAPIRDKQGELSPDDQRRINRLKADIKAAKDSLVSEEKNLKIMRRSFASLEAPHAEFVRQIYALDKDSGVSLEKETREGKLTNAVLRWMAGNGSDLTPEQKRIVEKDFANRPHDAEKLKDAIDRVARTLSKLPPAQQPDFGEIAKKVFEPWGLTGQPPDTKELLERAEQQTRANVPPQAHSDGSQAAAPNASNDDVTSSHAANDDGLLEHPQQEMRAGPQQSNQSARPQPATAGASANGAMSNDAIEDVRSFNPNDPNWVGLSKARRRELTEAGQSELLQAIDQYHSELRAFHMQSAARLSGLRSILRSGMPIEAIIVMFMALMTENEEHKLKLKMTETTVAEAFERANRKREGDRDFARNLLKSYRDKTADPADGEKIDPRKLAELKKVAGEVDVKGVTKEEAEEKKKRAEELLPELYGDKVPEGLDEEQQAELLEKRTKWPKELLEKDLNAKEIPDTVRIVDVDFKPADYGFTTKSSSTLTQELQAQMQSYKQMMETMTSVLRMLQDMVAKIITNIR